MLKIAQKIISIHALREEGDGSSSAGIWQRRLFLSTPSVRRATLLVHLPEQKLYISIHALREEGDGSPHVWFPGT